MHDQMGQFNVPASDSVPRDDELAKGMHSAVSEAAERVTFHRVELERWDRIGRAAQAALNHLQSAAPVAQMTPEGFLQDTSEPAPSYVNR